jgi:hypothetical protein
MVLYNVKFPEGDTVNPIQATGATVLTNGSKYRKWTSAVMVQLQLQFYMTRGTSIKAFHKECLVDAKIPEKTFGTYFRESGLKLLQDSNTDFEIAKLAIEHYVAKVKKNATNRVIAACASRRFLTDQEEETLVHLCLTLGKAGRGVDRDELLDMINEVINVGTDERERESATEKVVRDILERHPSLMKLVNSGSLDPLRAKKANKKTRDTVFSKLQAQIRGLYAQGKIPWQNYCDIPAHLIFNMDEVGTDTTKHRRKVIADMRNVFQRIFTITPEGDRMKGHITACVTTRADGTSIFANIILLVVVADCRVGFFY